MNLDTAVFKKLAHNDTGAAAGHQGGIVIPKDIARFFPPLPFSTDGSNPTVDTRLTADLYIGTTRVASVMTRYQHQTWGGTRSPERRLTDNLGPLRNMAAADDIIIFRKDLSDDGYIRLHLLKQGTEEYDRLLAKVGPKRWGAVDSSNPPVSIDDMRTAEEYVQQEADRPARPFCDEREQVKATTIRRARDRAFRRKVLELYDFRCAFTGRRFVSPVSAKIVGLDAAHIVPVDANGSDHPANGLALTKDLHWSFDRGLLGVGQNRRIIVPESVRMLPGNEFLRDLNGTAIREAGAHSLEALEEAFDWHRRNVLLA